MQAFDAYEAGYENLKARHGALLDRVALLERALEDITRTGRWIDAKLIAANALNGSPWESDSYRSGQ
jgi:hypothetical protein